MDHPGRMERDFDPAHTPFYLEWLRVLVMHGDVPEQHVLIELLQAFVIMLLAARVRWSNLGTLKMWCMSLRAQCQGKVYRFLRGAVGFSMGRTSEQSLHILRIYNVNRM